MTATTPIYALPYLENGQPQYQTRQVLQDLVFALEARLQAAGLAAVNASDLLAVSGRVSTLEGKAQAYLYAKTAQSGLATGYNTITLDAELIDTANGHGAGPGYVIPTGRGGRWTVSAAVAIGTVGTGNASGVTVGARLMVNGAAVKRPPISMPVSSQNGCVVPYPAVSLDLAAGDVVTLQGYVNTGGWLTLADTVTGGSGASTSFLNLVQS